MNQEVECEDRSAREPEKEQTTPGRCYGIRTEDPAGKNRQQNPLVMKQLNKKQALELLPLVVDGEADRESEIAFYRFIETHEEVRSQFKNMQRIKHLLRTRLPRMSAPASLKRRISQAIESSGKW